MVTNYFKTSFGYLGGRGNYQALSPFRDDSFRFYSISNWYIKWCSWVTSFVRFYFSGESLIHVFEYSVFAIKICKYFDQKLAALYIEVCFKSIIYSWFCLIICCSNDDCIRRSFSLFRVSVAGTKCWFS